MFSRLLTDKIESHGDKVLLSDRSRNLSGHAVSQFSNVCAHHIISSGISPGDRVGIAIRDQIDAMVFFLGAIRAGAVPVFLDFRTKPDQKAKMIDLMSLAALFDTAKNTDYHEKAITVPADWFHSDEMTVSIFRDQTPDSNGMLAISSGTTGFPKAYVIHEDVWSRRTINTRTYEPEMHSTILVPTSLSFAGTQFMIFPALYHGLTLRFMPLMFSTKELISALSSKDVTGILIPPAILFNLLAEIGEPSSPAFPHMKMLKCTGGSISPQNAIDGYRYLTHAFEKGYGATLIGTASRLIGENVLVAPDSIGKLRPGNQVEILDQATGETLPTGSVGVMKFKSDIIVREVISSAPSDEAYGEGYGIPGDIGYVDESGYLYITGRMADVIVRGGIAVAPSAIENLLRPLDGIDDVAAIGVEDQRLGQEIAIFVVTKSLSIDDVKQLVMKTIDQDKRPRFVRLISAIPFTSNGKLDRKELQAMFTLGQ